jgi:hypothetical protein
MPQPRLGRYLSDEQQPALHSAEIGIVLGSHYVGHVDDDALLRQAEYEHSITRNMFFILKDKQWQRLKDILDVARLLLHGRRMRLWSSREFHLLELCVCFHVKHEQKIEVDEDGNSQIISFRPTARPPAFR